MLQREVQGNKRVLRNQRLSDLHKDLHSAIEKSQIEKVKKLIIEKHEIPCIHKGNNCFHVASAEDIRMQKLANMYSGVTWDILLFLVEIKPEGINSIGSKGKTLLMTQVGHEAHFTYLLSKGASLEMTDDDGTTILHEATLKGAPVPVLDKILKCGLDINTKDNKQETPIFNAIKQCNLDHFAFLKGKNCDLSTRNKIGNTPLHVVCGTHKLSGPCFNWSELEEFNKKRDEMFRDLLSAGIDINSGNKKRETPLHILAHHKNTTHLMEMIIAKGADVNLTDLERKTPLMHIFDKNKFQDGRRQVACLVQNGADVNIKDKSGKTILSSSIFDTIAFVYLLSKGADPLLKDDRNRTVLFDAVEGLCHIPHHLGRHAPVDASVILHLLRSGCPLEDFNRSATNTYNHLKDVFFKLLRKCYAYHNYHNGERVFVALHKCISLFEKEKYLELLKLLKEKNYNFASHQDHCSILTVCLMKRLLQMLKSPPRDADHIERITLAELKDVILPCQPQLQQRVVKYLDKTSEKWAERCVVPDAIFIALQSGNIQILEFLMQDWNEPPMALLALFNLPTLLNERGVKDIPDHFGAFKHMWTTTLCNVFEVLLTGQPKLVPGSEIYIEVLEKLQTWANEFPELKSLPTKFLQLYN